MKKKKPKRSMTSMADELVEDAKSFSDDKKMQLEHLRLIRDVTYNGNFKMQLAVATAIDKLKGYYK